MTKIRDIDWNGHVPDHEPWAPPIVHPSVCVTWLAAHWGPLGHLDVDPGETYTAVPIPDGACYVSIRPIERAIREAS